MSTSPGSQPAVWVENSSNQWDCTWSGTIALSSSGGSLTTDTAVASTCLSLTATTGFAQPTGNGCDFAGAIALVSQNTYQATQYILTASVSATNSTAATPGTSNAFGVSTYGAATQLAYYLQPIGVAAATASTAFISQSVSIPFVTTSTAQAVLAVEDSFGNVVATAKNGTNTMVPTFSFPTGSGGGTLSSCALGTLTSGYYLVTGCHGTAYSNNVLLKATNNFSVTVNGSTSTPSVTSTTFSISGVPHNLIFSTAPVPGASGAIFTTMPVIEVVDSNGLVVTAATGGTLSLTPSGGTLSNCTNLTLVSGVVSPQNCTFAGLESTSYTLSASITVTIGGSNYPVTGTSGSFSPTLPGAATQLVFTTSPVAGAAGSSFTTMPVVYVEDSSGNLVTSSNAVITLAASGGTLSNCANLAATGGVVNVSDCTFGGLVGSPTTNLYTLTASSTGLTSGTSGTFYVTAPGPVSQLVLNLNVSGSSCSPSILYQGTCAPSATYEDAYGNTATTDNATITFQNSGTGGSSVSATAPTQTLGVASETLTGTGIGTISVYATGGGFTSTTGTFIVNKAPQTVNFYTDGTYTNTTTGNSLTYGTASTYQTYAQGSQLGAITFNSTTTSVCTVNSTGLITIVTAGSCVITADAAATTNYADSGTTNFTLTINKAAQTVAFYTAANGGGTITTGNSLTYGTAATYQTYAQGSQLGTITFNSTTTSVCTVNSSGVITIVTAGSCVITADAAATTNYADSGTTNFTLTINRASQTISYTAPTRASENSGTYTPSGTSTSGLALTFTVTGDCTITGGVITFSHATGNCVVSANQAGNVDYNAATQVQQTITVVNLGFTSLATQGAASNTATTASITATAGSKLVILVAFTSRVAGNTCGTPTSAAFTGATAIVATYQFDPAPGGANPYDYECAYTATATGNAGTVTETDNGTANGGNPQAPSTVIQVMGITGDNSAVVTNAGTGAGSSTTATFNLGAAPVATSLELAFGAASYAQNGTQPTFSTPTGFNATTLSPQPAGGYPSVVGYIFDGPAVNSVGDTVAPTSIWGTIGLEIQP
jgi:hypothetical protein